jgi:hypothetical protein
MKKRMSLAVFASLLAVPLTMMPGRAAPEGCLAGPDRQPPEGSHWYYRLDRETHRKCWYLGQQGAKVHRVAVPRPDRATRPSAVEKSAEPAEKPVDPPVADTPVVTEATPEQTPRWLDAPKPIQAFEPASAWVSIPIADQQPIADPQPVAPDAAGSTAPPSVTPARPVTVEATGASSKLLLVLLAAALTLAAVIGRAIFRHAEAPRLFRRDVLDHVAPGWDAPLGDDRTVPASMRQHRSVPHDNGRRNVALASHGNNVDDDIEAMLRQLHRDWERVAA